MKRGSGFTLARLGWVWLIFGGLVLFGTVSLVNHGTMTLPRGIEISAFLLLGGAIMVGIGNYTRQ